MIYYETCLIIYFSLIIFIPQAVKQIAQYNDTNFLNSKSLHAYVKQNIPNEIKIA